MELTKDEKRALLETVRTEGWKIARKFLNEYADVVQGELVSASDKDVVMALAYKLKFGTLSLYSFFVEIERIAKELDNNKDL
jgi:hypothetical protein